MSLYKCEWCGEGMKEFWKLVDPDGFPVRFCSPEHLTHYVVRLKPSHMQERKPIPPGVTWRHATKEEENARCGGCDECKCD